MSSTYNLITTQLTHILPHRIRYVLINHIPIGLFVMRGKYWFHKNLVLTFSFVSTQYIHVYFYFMIEQL